MPHEIGFRGRLQEGGKPDEGFYPEKLFKFKQPLIGNKKFT